MCVCPENWLTVKQMPTNKCDYRQQNNRLRTHSKWYAIENTMCVTVDIQQAKSFVNSCVWCSSFFSHTLYKRCSASSLMSMPHGYLFCFTQFIAMYTNSLNCFLKWFFVSLSLRVVLAHFSFGFSRMHVDVWECVYVHWIFLFWSVVGAAFFLCDVLHN